MKRDFELGFEPGKEQEEQVEMQIANRKYTVYFCSNEEPAACADGTWESAVSWAENTGGGERGAEQFMQCGGWTTFSVPYK